MTTAAIDLRIWPLDVGASELRKFCAMLSEDERARAARFVFPVHANRFIAGRGRLREILGERLGEKPETLRFAYGKHGKPALDGKFADGRLHFNLAHSGDIAALAVAVDVEVGVDLEFVKPIEDDVARFHFSGAEYAALSRLSADDWLPGFYRCWTRKEAVVKAIGEGLSLPLDRFDVTLGAGEPARVLRMADEGNAREVWSLHHFEPAPGYMGAIAARAGGHSLEVAVRSAPGSTGGR
ncbi:MAG: 4'-phosphopantetheinyl transferase superfamily protein [Alphaproteobacteria bacterium]|nr:4'-phosphopantetheinyl transferase superfamily protein [Alphaproteobacteria bacterium]